MKLIHAEMKMSEVIHRNYLLIPVINRFGIHLGFGEKSVGTLCQEKNIDSDFFVTILNTFSNENYFPEKKLKSFNILAIVNYLRETHKYYLYSMVPEIGTQIENLAQSCSQQCKHIELVTKFYKNYVDELSAHISREENITFPYIISLYEMYRTGFDQEKFNKMNADYSMDIYDKQHDNIDDKLYDLKSILIKYLNGEINENLVNTIVFNLFKLENDIQDHTRIEDMILQPLVLEIENSFKSKILSSAKK